MTDIAESQWSAVATNLLLVATVDPMEIGRRIKQAREQKGWTQLVFALEANVSPSTVTRWESGKLPPVRELIRVAQLLGVDPDYFVGDDGPLAPRPVTVVEYAEEIVKRLDAGELIASSLLAGLAEDLDRLAEQAGRVAARLRQAGTSGKRSSV